MTRTLRTIPGIFFKRWREPTVCEACGNGFACGATLAGCWCSELKLSEETRMELRSRYSGCLCRNCLEQFAEVKQPAAGETSSARASESYRDGSDRKRDRQKS